MCFLGGRGNCHAGIVLYMHMIGKLTGRFESSGPSGTALIEVGGVGYSVRVPASSLARLQAGDVSLYIHTAVREDAIDLYGFPEPEELAFFKQLMSVSGVGPKTALAIMSVAEVATLARAIAAGDSGTLTKVFGIGKRTAERIVVELKDKMLKGVRSDPSSSLGANDSEAIEALMALGYGAAECRKALGGIEGGDLKERLGLALRRLGGAHV